MKIIFICGSLEPGRDGVGDYTRRLAEKMTEQGHQIAVIALKDEFCTKEFAGSFGVKNSCLPILRLPSALSVKYRLNQAKKYIDQFDPDWLSLQFVPFMFHCKGLPLGLARQLAFLGSGRRWHIMFHELWLGIEAETSRKKYYWGLVQKYIIKRLVKRLRPGLIHTQTRLYQKELSKIDVNAQYLPLFGNIPLLETMEIEAGAEQRLPANNKLLLLVIFGGIHPGAPVEDFAEEFGKYSKKKGVNVSLTLAGRCGKEQEKWVKVWQTAGMSVRITGELPPEKLSCLLKSSSVGISTTPLSLTEKSGSVAAMSNHGLPILCVAKKWCSRNFSGTFNPLGILEYQKGNLEYCLANSLKVPENYSVSEVSKQLTSAFQMAQTIV